MAMVLTYHEIVEHDSPYAYSTTCRRLEEHLHLLGELHATKPQLTSPALVTFDDGHASHHRHGFSLARAYQCQRAIFFVTVGWIDTMRGYMSWSQVKEIAESGYEIQSHGWSHESLTICSASGLKHELECSKATLEDRLGMPVSAISVPGGFWRASTMRACADAGYKQVYISDPWFGQKERDGVQVIGRLMVRRTMSAEDLRLLLEAEKKVFSLHRLPYRFRQTVRQLLGERVYHELWCWVARDAKRKEISQSYEPALEQQDKGHASPTTN